MVDPVQDWGKIDQSNETELKKGTPRVSGCGNEYSTLISTLDTMLEVKTFATEKQIHVPGLSKLIEKYLQAVSQGTELREQGLWNKLRNLRDWHDSKRAFKNRCQTVWEFAHQTSFLVHTSADKLEAVPQVPLRRRRSVDGAVQAELDLDLIQPHNRHDDTPVRPTPPDAGPVASSSNHCIHTNPLPEETVRHIAEMSAAKTLERFILYGKSPGWIPQTINNFNGCIVRPGGRATHTVNFGGRNNRGAVVNTCSSPTEVEGNGVDEIDGISDDELLHDTAVDATRSVSERHSSPAEQ